MGVLVRNRVGDLANVARTTREDMQDLGLLARERIILRTRQGRDGNNVPFQPYTQAYADQRAKEGLSRSNVTLELSGGMLNGIKIIAGTSKVRLTF
jgi:hypothetical protein